jgi:hypothetical protein
LTVCEENVSVLQETVDTHVSNNFAEGMQLKLQIYCKTSRTILYFLSVGTSSHTTIAINIVHEQWEILSTGKQ